MLTELKTKTKVLVLVKGKLGFQVDWAKDKDQGSS
jgi:hypothetical protein